MNEEVSESQELPTLPVNHVSVDNVYLVHARFVDTMGPEPIEIPPITEAPLTFSIALGRTRPDRLTIAIGVNVAIQQPYLVEVMYAGEFTMHPDVPLEDRADIWKRAAAHLAPIVLYPYIRETIQSLTLRSQSEVLILPVLSFQTVAPDEIELPPLPDEDADQLNLHAS